MITDPRCDLKLFIENIACSVISASISTAVKLTATVEVLPTKEVRALTPMTNIVVGYRDPMGKHAELVDQSGVPYSVLFVGMISSISITKSGVSRTATLACVGHQTLLERHYAFISNIATQSFSHKRKFVGASAFLRTELGAGGLAQQVAAVFKDAVPPFTPGLTDLTGPPRGAIKLIEKCIGVTLPAGASKEGEVHGAQHEFFAHASHQCRLLFQIGGVSVDEGLNSIIDKDSTGKVLSSASARMSDITDLTTMLDILLKQMYYQILPLGAPKTVVSTDTSIIQRGDILTELQQEYDVSGLGTNVGDKVPTTIGTPILIQVKVASDMIYKDIEKSTKQDAVAEKRLRDLLLDTDGKSAGFILPHLQDKLRELIPKERMQTFVDMNAPHLFQLIKTYRSGAALTEKNATLVHTVSSTLLRNIAAISKVKPATDESSKFCRVVSYLVMPDLTFCAPPTCNVIFPNQISTLSYNKDAFNMPSRLLLHSEVVANAKEQDAGIAGYYAPSTTLFADSQGTIVSNTGEIPLLEHEKFTGIVPSFASISFYEKFKTLGSGKNTDEIMLRIANFNLMLQRYQSNGITCSGPFNPFVAVGFPIAFIDVDDVNAENPSTYIGILSSVSHSYSGSGTASTSYTVRYVREVGEVDEIFGDAVMRGTNNANATALLLTHAGDGSPNPIKSALRAALSCLHNKALFLAAYDLNQVHELVISGTSTTVKTEFQQGDVLSQLEKALPLELRGQTIYAAMWQGLSIYTPDLIQKNLDDPLTQASYVVKKIESEPYVNDIKASAKSARATLMKNFVENDQTKALAAQLHLVMTTYPWAGSFTESALTTVVEGKTLLSLLNQKAVTTLKEGVQDERNFHALRGQVTVTWWKLMPVDVDRLITQVEGGKVSFFDKALVLPKNVLSSVSAYLNATTDGSSASEKIAVEELYRPPWYNDIFSIAKIGQSVYKPVLGCGSIQDVVPTSIPRDTSVNTDAGVVLAHTTKTSLLQAYQGYSNAGQNAKSEYVNAFVRRPISNIQDVLGLHGLLTTEVADACVVDLRQMCNPTKVRDLAAVDTTTKSLTFDPNVLVSEKRHNVTLYVNSTKGDAFR